jgi:4-alpha-glucanotransferase
MTPPLRSSGILLHPTSLPGPHGSGDLGPEAWRFVDWLHEAGQTQWQMLPINPAGPGHSPYMSVSAFAGNPLMVALQPLVARGWLAEPEAPAGGFDPLRSDFDRVAPWRLARLRQAATGFFERASPADRLALAAWSQLQAAWLPDYALFMALHTAHGGQPWWTWPVPLRDRHPRALQAAREQHGAEMAFWRWVQWCFDAQFAELKAHAHARGVALVGDLPIFVAHDSVDCWSRPDLYWLDDEGRPTVIAGVPPDDLGPLGQRWGNPLYRWDRMAGDDYAWWTARVQRAMTHADVFRIDHFLGFSAYWEIPADSPTAQVGRWVPGPGRALFEAIGRALGPLPIIAEDLGLVTDEVRALRDSCGFPGMKILQFAFGTDGSHEFLPHNCGPQVVMYTGTHDNDTARGWWDNAPARERAYCADYLGCTADDVHWAMLRVASQSVARWVVFPLQDVLGLGSEHRMNLPGTLGGSNWAWRFAWEQLSPPLAQRLARLARQCGRAGPKRPQTPAAGCPVQPAACAAD